MKKQKMLTVAMVALAMSLAPVQDVFAYDDSLPFDYKYSDFSYDMTGENRTEMYQFYDSLIKFSNQSVNKKTLTSGDTVRFYIDVDDSALKALSFSDEGEAGTKISKYIETECMSEGRGVENLALVLASEKNESCETILLKKSMDNADGSSRYTGKMKIGAYTPSGKWKIKDLYVNYFYSEEESGVAMKYYNKEIYANPTLYDLSWGNFRVTGTKKDEYGPKVYDVKVEKLSQGKRKISWKVKGNNLKKCYIDNYNGSHHTNTKKIKEKNGRYTYVTDEKFADDIDNEVKINVVDQAGNSAGVTYSCYEEKVVTGQNQEYANVKPKASDVKLSQKRVEKGQDVKISLKLSAQDTSKLQNIVLCYASPYGGYTKCVKLKHKKDSVWEGTFYTVSSMPTGKWTLAAINFNEKFLLENKKYCKSIIEPQSNVKFRQNLSAGNITVD